ncbi:MAG: trypsin-like peptidase domain-containing protein [Proteobacteria bacterium]|nr:trypsin-like peptidase domain-containing protein [Pseudomonadota bacterium]
MYDSRNSTPSPHRGPTAITRWLAILLLLVAAALVYTVLQQRNLSRDTGPAEEPRAITPRGDLAADEQATIELFRELSPSVVHITNVTTRRNRFSLNVMEIPQGTGSGLVWDDHGHIVTNFHVIRGASHAEVQFSGHPEVYRGEIIGVAEDKDLAVVRIDAPRSKLRAIPVGTSNNLQVGQKVFAIGNPFGLDQTLTTGVISGLGREIQSVTERPIYDVIQTDASINPGNSGGPLIDSAGRLIGVNTAIYSPSGGSAGIGFAVPVDTVNRIVPQLIQHGRVVRPGLGISIGSAQAAAQLNLEGVLIVKVFEGTAAAAAGLRGVYRGPSGGWILGDIIVAMSGVRVLDANDLYRLLDQHKVGDKVPLTIVRKGQRLEVEVTLQALPN